MAEIDKINKTKIFQSTLWFVLGFAVVFALLGVLIQTVFAYSSIGFQTWVSRFAGAFIIFFGIFMLDLVPIPALLREHKITVKKFKSVKLTSFLFGSAFAVGWTPCVSAALGAIIALAAVNPSSSFFLLMAYAAGIGLPFIIFGFFIDKVPKLLEKWGNIVFKLRYLFAGLIIVLGILIFTQRLSDVANVPLLVNLVTSLGLGTSAGAGISSLTFVNLIIAFIAGLFSFISPCVLPLLPTFLSYLASITIQNEK